jgi:hypothetical protein
MPSVYTLQEDAQKLSLQHDKEHITFDTKEQKLSIEQHSLFGLRKKTYEIPFSQIENLSLDSKPKEGKDAAMVLRVSYLNEKGESHKLEIPMQVKDLDQRAEVMDLLFRMGRTMTSEPADGAFRESEPTLMLDRYLVQTCTDHDLSLSLVRSTTPESIQGRPLPPIEEPANYLSNEAAQRIEAPLPAFSPKRFLGLYRFLSWVPGKRVELLGTLPRGPVGKFLYRLASIATPALFSIIVAISSFGIDLGKGVEILSAMAFDFAGIYLLAAWLFKRFAWNPDKPLAKFSIKNGGLLIALGIVLDGAMVAAINAKSIGLGMLFLLGTTLSLLCGGTGLAARRNLKPEHVVKNGGTHALLDWEEKILKNESGRTALLDSVQELVCSLNEEVKDGKTFYFSRLEAVVPGEKIRIAESERFLKTRLEPYFALAPMGEEIAKALNVKMRSEDKTTAQNQTETRAVQEVVQEEVPEVVNR